MKTDRLEIANGLTGAGMSAEHATTIATAIGEAIEDAVKDMASLKDLDVISARSDARIDNALRLHTIWTVGAIAALGGLIIALKLFG